MHPQNKTGVFNEGSRKIRVTLRSLLVIAFLFRIISFSLWYLSFSFLFNTPTFCGSWRRCWSPPCKKKVSKFGYLKCLFLFLVSMILSTYLEYHIFNDISHKILVKLQFIALIIPFSIVRSSRIWKIRF